MKSPLILIFAALLLAPSVSQSQNKLDADGKQALPFVKTAVDIALNMHHGSLNQFLGVYVTYRDWDGAARDGDLGPFMKVKQASPQGGRSAVCLFAPKKDSAICVYFDEKTPFGVVAVKAGADGKLGDASETYQRVSAEMRQKTDQKLTYLENTVTTDYGYQLTGFQITAP